jgi:hypothetical protein
MRDVVGPSKPTKNSVPFQGVTCHHTKIKAICRADYRNQQFRCRRPMDFGPVRGRLGQKRHEMDGPNRAPQLRDVHS